MNEIQRASEKILDHLIARHSKDNNFLFVPRMKNNKNRLSSGYWFRGNDGYLQVTFWIGADDSSGVYQIAFVYKQGKRKECYIELSCRQNIQARPFIQLVARSLGLKFTMPRPNHYFWYYEGVNYLENLDNFINNIKPRIDDLVNANNPPAIRLPDREFFDKYAGRIISHRKKQIERGKTDKICRICWNDKNWILPSGWKNKNIGESFESEYGFGHEEWLLDRSKVIDGYHYAFLQPLLVQKKRDGIAYNITLITSPGKKVFYLVGKINNVELVSHEHSAEIFEIYKSSGWIPEMIENLKLVNAKYEEFINTNPQNLFNIRFRFEDYQPQNELLEISEDDINISNNRYILLKQKENIILACDSDTDSVHTEDDSAGFSGNFKKTEKRRRSYVAECEFDPVHDKMQNGLKILFNSANNYGYSNPKTENHHVDLKAIAESGNWHYFEIKTDPPKLSIRKALGQILEYAMYPDKMRAEKYVIISQYKPNEDVVRYLRNLRNQYKIPVVYRYYDINNNFLSEEYPES